MAASKRSLAGRELGGAGRSQEQREGGRGGGLGLSRCWLPPLQVPACRCQHTLRLIPLLLPLPPLNRNAPCRCGSWRLGCEPRLWHCTFIFHGHLHFLHFFGSLAFPVHALHPSWNVARVHLARLPLFAHSSHEEVRDLSVCFFFFSFFFRSYFQSRGAARQGHVTALVSPHLQHWSSRGGRHCWG